jgi:hypothetical protein
VKSSSPDVQQKVTSCQNSTARGGITTLGENYILGFYIAMNYSSCMEILYAFHNLAHYGSDGSIFSFRALGQFSYISKEQLFNLITNETISSFSRKFYTSTKKS